MNGDIYFDFYFHLYYNLIRCGYTGSIGEPVAAAVIFILSIFVGNNLLNWREAPLQPTSQLTDEASLQPISQLISLRNLFKCSNCAFNWIAVLASGVRGYLKQGTSHPYPAPEWGLVVQLVFSIIWISNTIDPYPLELVCLPDKWLILELIWS